MGGPQSVKRQPNLLSRWILERATRLCSMSPMIVTLQILDVAAAIADGEGIEERLRGMLVGAVAGVDHRYIADGGPRNRRRPRNCGA